MRDGATTTISLDVSPETVWRHLTRVSDWEKWYPRLTSIDADTVITGADIHWEMSGLLGRIPYRGDVQVVDYEPLQNIQLESVRAPLRLRVTHQFTIRRDHHGSFLDVTITGESLRRWPANRLINWYSCPALCQEAQDVVDRFGAYLSRALPHH